MYNKTRRQFLTAVAGIVPVAGLQGLLSKQTEAPEFPKPEFVELAMTGWKLYSLGQGYSARLWWASRFNQQETIVHWYRHLHVANEHPTALELAYRVEEGIWMCRGDIHALARIPLPCSADEVSRIMSQQPGFDGPIDLLKYNRVPKVVTSIAFVKPLIGTPLLYDELQGGKS